MRALARASAGAELSRAWLTISPGRILTPPEALMIQLWPCFTMLTRLSTCVGAGKSSVFKRRFLHQGGQIAAGLVGQPLVGDQGPHQGQLHAVPQLAEDRHGHRQFVVMPGHVVGPLLRHGTRLARVLALTVGRGEILFRHALHAGAVEFPGQPVRRAEHRLVLRLQPPALHDVVHARRRLALYICRKLGMPWTGDGSKFIASRFMR